MQYWNDSPTRRVFLQLAHVAMHLTMERISRRSWPAQLGPAGYRIATADSLENRIRNSPPQDVRQASPDVAVMLHLRSCYVSKAAILTLPVQLVSVENRSPS
jgi:hypothetical protein